MNNLLSWLYAGHMVGDYLFQTRWMAERKTASYPALIVHAVIYSFSVWLSSLPVSPAGKFGLSPWSVLFVFAAHAIIDRQNVTKWWCKNVTLSNRMWLLIMTDQALHIVILATTCLIDGHISGGLF